jgi:hypothetical protein
MIEVLRSTVPDTLRHERGECLSGPFARTPMLEVRLGEQGPASVRRRSATQARINPPHVAVEWCTAAYPRKR